jgi:predicted TIM-barrel fold metal-dependent hydrolase
MVDLENGFITLFPIIRSCEKSEVPVYIITFWLFSDRRSRNKSAVQGIPRSQKVGFYVTQSKCLQDGLRDCRESSKLLGGFDQHRRVKVVLVHMIPRFFAPLRIAIAGGTPLRGAPTQVRPRSIGFAVANDSQSGASLEGRPGQRK